MARDYDTLCPKCGGLIARPNVNYCYSGEFCHCPDEEMIEAYAEYAKQEIRFCPYCGAALGIEEDEEDLADAEEALQDYAVGEGIPVVETHERMRKEGRL